MKYNQETLVLGHLRTVGHITGVEAAAIYKIRSLPRRIATLRDAGHNIISLHKKDMTGQRYVKYVYDYR